MGFTENMLRPVPLDLEPKRKNRWYIEFPSDVGIAEWAVQTAARPKLAIEETEIPFMNTSTWVAGRAVWESMDIEFIDTIGPSTGQAVVDWIRQCIEFSTGRMGYAASYKKTLILKMLDPTGQTIEKWTLYGCFITNADWGDLDMGSDDLAMVSVTVRFDRAVLNF
jgi:hypothetical protein